MVILSICHLGKSLLGTALFLTIFAGGVSGCAERQKKATVKELRDTSESFARHLRWGDYRGMAKFIIPEERLPYVKGILDRGEDETLKVLDFELEHVHYVPPGDNAIILSRISWYRLPSVTAKSEVVTLHFKDCDGEWLVKAIENGPLPFGKPGGNSSKETDSSEEAVHESFNHL